MLDDRSVVGLTAVQGGVGQLNCLCMVCLQQLLMSHVISSENCCWDSNQCSFSTNAPDHTPDGVWCNKEMKGPAASVREKPAGYCNN